MASVCECMGVSVVAGWDQDGQISPLYSIPGKRGDRQKDVSIHHKEQNVSHPSISVPLSYSFFNQAFRSFVFQGNRETEKCE